MIRAVIPVWSCIYKLLLHTVRFPGSHMFAVSQVEDAIAQLRHSIVLGLITFPLVAMALEAASPAAAAAAMSSSAAVPALLVAIGCV
jgi:hypothetical protein